MPINTIGISTAGGTPGMVLLFESILTGDTTVVTFADIPQTYNDLVIVIEARTTENTSTAGEGGEIIMEQNQVTSTGSYKGSAYRWGYATGVVTPLSSNAIGRATNSNSAAGSYGAVTCRLIDYAGTATKKVWQSYGTQHRAATGDQFYGWLYFGAKTDNTNAVTRLDFSVFVAARQDEQFVSGSTFRVYGVQ